jgi:hypothetical protein
MSTPCVVPVRNGEQPSGADEHALWTADVGELYDSVRRAADEVGHNELLYRLHTMDRTTLANRLSGNNGREPTFAMGLALARMQSSERMVQTFCRLSEFTPPKRLSNETSGDRFMRLVEAVRARHGQSGEETLRVVLGRQA